MKISTINKKINPRKNLNFNTFIFSLIIICIILFGNYSKINASTYEDKIQELIDFYIEMIDVETFKNLYDVYSKREVHIEEKKLHHYWGKNEKPQELPNKGHYVVEKNTGKSYRVKSIEYHDNDTFSLILTDGLGVGVGDENIYDLIKSPNNNPRLPNIKSNNFTLSSTEDKGIMELHHLEMWEIYSAEAHNFFNFYGRRTIEGNTITHSGPIYPSYYTLGAEIGDYAVEKSTGRSYMITDVEKYGGGSNTSYDIYLGDGKWVVDASETSRELLFTMYHPVDRYGDYRVISVVAGIQSGIQHGARIQIIYQIEYEYEGSGTGEILQRRGTRFTDVIYDSNSPYQIETRHSGKWYMIDLFKGRPNNPPTRPSSITVPSTIKGRESFTVTWGASTDPDGDSITYVLERQVNGGSWTQVYSGSNRSKKETPLTSWNTVRYRVRAYDGIAYSDYRTSLTRTVIHNSPPTTPANISVPSYVKENESYTVTWGTSTDADGDSITYYLERQINGGSWTQIYSGSSRSKTESPQSSWNTVRYRVRAYDGIAYSSYRTSNIVTVDRDNPILRLTHSPTSWTNNNVTITATGSDDTSGVKRIQKPDGTWVSSSRTTYTVSSNGTYTFTVEDNAGNTTTESIEIKNIDKISPTVDITDNDNNWYKSFTVNISHSDDGGSGIKTRRYSITNNTTEPTSGWINLTSENQNINISTNGNNYVHVQVIDNANNETYVYKGPFKIDNTAPTIETPIAEAISPTEIKIIANANDNLSGLHTTPYMFNRDSKDITTDWISSNTLVDNNLIANKQYSYKYKARDSLENISDYSSEVKRYTLALDPVRVWFVDSSDTSVTLEIEHNTENANIPEVRIVLKERGTSNIVSTSNWSKETTRVLTGLQAGKEYEVYLTTRNGDNIENPEIKAPLVDTEGNPIDYVVTVVPVNNFRVIESSVNSLTVSWDQVYSQEYQVYLKDELGNEIPNTRSNWIADDTYTFSNLPLPNTKYVPYIITRKVNSTIHLPEKKVLNEERAYTDAENLTYATFEPFKTSIKITLDTTKSKNPADTEYILRNDINGTTKTVVHSNPVWENTNLKEESFYIYSVKVINKNGKPSDYFKLIFRNGEPHTLMPDIEVPNLVDPKDYIDLDRLKTWDYNKPIDYFVPTELNNKYVKHDDIIYYTTSEKSVTIGNDNEVNALYYAVSDDGYGYTRWRELNEGYFNEVVEFNAPGKYKVHFIFKNYNIESETAIVNYFVDWLKPTIKGESAIKGQTAVTDDSFTVNIEIEDNVSPYLFYSIDDGNTWYLLKDDINQITFNNIIKSREGTMNRLTITICDINSNTTSKTFTVWGIDK